MIAFSPIIEWTGFLASVCGVAALIVLNYADSSTLPNPWVFTCVTSIAVLPSTFYPLGFDDVEAPLFRRFAWTWPP